MKPKQLIQRNIEEMVRAKDITAYRHYWDRIRRAIILLLEQEIKNNPAGLTSGK
jgi:hypothetical protein